jgi:hypothetical protein
MLLLALAVTTACGGDDDDESDDCANANGSWAINGCYSFNCTIAQNECSTTVTCNTLGGDLTFTGSVSGNEITFADENGGTCEGVIADDQMVGTCTSETGTCDFDADRR